MLALPVKRSDPCNVTTNLETFIAKEYPDETNKFSSDIATFQQVRNAAVMASVSSGQIGLQQLLLYNYHAKSMSKRLSGYESETKFTFAWSDAFRPNNRCTSGNFNFDWASNLWNMASFESHTASTIDRGSDDGVRQASLHFQQSAGIVEFIRTEVIKRIVGPKSPELSDAFLRMIVGLLLAQAQVCFYEKAVKERKSGGGMKPAIIAKLAQQVGVFYWNSVELCREKEVNVVIDPSWIYHMEFQRDTFRGAAEYWQSVAVKDDALNRGEGYGEEITRLRKADSMLSQAISQGRSKHVSLQSIATAEAMQKTIRKGIEIAEKDNSTIYHDRVPEYTSLQAVAPVPMVKATGLPEYYNKDTPLFASLCPKGVRELVTLRQQRVDALLRDVTATATSATNEGRASLSAIGLPGSLEVYVNGGELPDNLWKKLQQIQSMGGLAELKRKYEEVEGLSERARNTIDGIRNSIQREENADRAFRERYPQCQHTPSSRLNGSLQTTTSQMLAAHETARQHDDTVAYNLQDSQFLEQMRMLGLSKAEIIDMLPAPSAGPSSSPVDPMVSRSGSRCDTAKLEGLLSRIAKLFTSREETLESLRAKATVDPTDALMDQLGNFSGDTQGVVTEEVKNGIIASHMSALDEDVRAIHSTLQEQQAIMQEVYEENILFTNARENDPVTREREEVMRSFEQGISSYFAMSSQLNAGSTFYRDMQSRLTSLMQQCDDLSYTQQLQRQDYEAILINQQDRMSQEQRDHEMALRLAQEMEESAKVAASATNPPPVQTPPGSQQGAPSQSGPSYPFGGPSSSPSPYNVVYGQPVNGPPSSSGVPPPPPPPPRQPLSQSAPYDPAPYRPNPAPVTSGGAAPYVYNSGLGESTCAPPSASHSHNSAASTPMNPFHHHQQQQQQEPSYSRPPAAPRGPEQYPSLPGQSPIQYHQQQMMPSQGRGSTLITESKVSRLMEMGFDRNAVTQALTANSDDEESALNSLLSGSATDTPPATVSNPDMTDAGVEQRKSGGMFSHFWGK